MHPPVLPLTLHWQAPSAPPSPPLIRAPYGRLIPCETIVALESNRLDTPVIGLVTEDVWHDGRRVIPAGAEVHGRAALDRTRERLAVQGAWHIVWRTTDADNGTDLNVEGLALDRDRDAETGRWDERDGSAGLRGEVVKSQDDRELKLFAATFLAAATTALQDTRTTAGLLGEAVVPVASARSATLAGTSAILRDYAQQMKDAIQRDGFYLRIPAGKQFYLYVTQPIERPARLAAVSRQP
ncbi:MAG TPA: TrbI/VirB10 family protein [Lacunisphaera sp.]|nr:TrbI/VirB10 family protein [Lacunisphaera sp.]